MPPKTRVSRKRVTGRMGRHTEKVLYNTKPRAAKKIMNARRLSRERNDRNRRCREEVNLEWMADEIGDHREEEQGRIHLASIKARKIIQKQVGAGGEGRTPVGMENRVEGKRKVDGGE